MSLSRRGRASEPSVEGDITSVFDWVNAFSDIITVAVVTAGVAVVVAHRLERVPRMAFQIVTPATTGQGVIFPGGVAWTTTTVSLTATVAGTYHVLLRR